MAANAHAPKTMQKSGGPFKYKITFSQLKAFELTSADFIGKNVS